MLQKYNYNDTIIHWDSSSNRCPFCGKYVVIAKQKPEDGCIKVRFYKCTVCDFDSRNFDRYKWQKG